MSMREYKVGDRVAFDWKSTISDDFFRGQGVLVEIKRNNLYPYEVMPDWDVTQTNMDHEFTGETVVFSANEIGPVDDA